MRDAWNLNVTRESYLTWRVTRESYLTRNVIREYLSACDAWFISWGIRELFVFSCENFVFLRFLRQWPDSKRDGRILLKFVRENGITIPPLPPSLYEVYFRLLGTNGFQGKNERLTADSRCCPRSEPKIWHFHVVIFPAASPNCTKKRAARAARLFFINQSNHWFLAFSIPLPSLFLKLPLRDLTQWRQQRGSHTFAYWMRKKTMISARAARSTRAFFYFDTFVCRPLWNKDVKWPNLKSCEGPLHSTLKGEITFLLGFSNPFIPVQCLDSFHFVFRTTWSNSVGSQILWNCIFA